MKELEFETIKSNKNRLYLFIGIVCVVVLLITIIVSNTLAKYRVKDSVPIINSKINYKVPDLNMVSLYVANEDGTYVEADTIPSSGYILNTEQSYCGRSNNGEIVKDDTVSIVYENGSISVDNITKKGTKCYLYFDIGQTITAGEQILANSTNQLTRADFSTTVEDTTTGTIYYEDTSNGRTYYFAGNPTDNWVQFAGFYWRIIRINEDGSIRLIYSGNSSSGPVSTGEGTQIGKSAFNSTDNNNAYVGYMYQSGQVYGLINDSTIKGVLDTWYEDNIQADYAQYLSTEAGFCGDRSNYTNTSGTTVGGGTGTTQTYYGAFIRLLTNRTPTFECQNNSDLYTVASSSQGNKVLDYPIGLITADEVVYGGLAYNDTTINNYLYTEQNYWTMTPSFFDGSYPFVFYVSSSGNFSRYFVSDSFGVRPVINLSADVTITGSGTVFDPYKVQ